MNETGGLQSQHSHLAIPMKLKSLLLLALAALLTLAVPRSARAANVSFEFFHDSLSPYGEWMEVGGYGYCWRPNGVDQDWAPYSDGYWAYTDAGWTWVSYEDYGGIVYHYGRWAKVEDEGWVWVPDYEWGPAWVSWRKNDDYVGWAPLPAEARWHRDRGLSVWVDSSYDIGPASYSFCRFRDFGAPVLRPVIIRREENFVIINNTVNITNITYNSGSNVIFNGGLEYAFVNRFARRPIPALKLVHNTNVTVINNHIVNNNVRITNINPVQRGNQLTIIAPNVTRPEPAVVAAFLKPKVTKVIAQEKVTKGWGSVPEEQRVALREKLHKETEGKTPETMPAAPVRTADLKVVPVKADLKAKLPTVNRNVVATPGDTDVKKTPEAIAKVPVVPPPTTPPDAAVAGKTVGKKPGKNAPPKPADAPEITGNPAVVKEKEMPVRPGVVKPFNPQGDANTTGGDVRSATTKPDTAVEKRNAAAEAAKKRAEAQAAAREKITGNPPTVTEKEMPVRPGVVKPFNPQGDANTPGGAVRSAPTTDAAVEKRNVAAEAAKKRAEAQAAAREKLMQQNQQQEIVRQNKAQEAAVARQRLQQQQQLQEQAVTRKHAVEAPQVQQNQQQEILRERAAKAAEARNAAREQAVERPQIQPQRNLPPAVQQQQQQQQIQKKVPVKPGKKLTPEEAAAIQQQQQQPR